MRKKGTGPGKIPWIPIVNPYWYLLHIYVCVCIVIMILYIYTYTYIIVKYNIYIYIIIYCSDTYTYIYIISCYSQPEIYSIAKTPPFNSHSRNSPQDGYSARSHEAGNPLLRWLWARTAHGVEPGAKSKSTNLQPGLEAKKVGETRLVHMYMYKFVYTYIYIHICIHIHTYIYIDIYTYIHICTHQ